jgi:hypothetical protein
MPVTALKIGDLRIKFMTTFMEPVVSEDGTTTKDFITVDLVQCDEDFIPSSDGSRTIDERSHEEYHKMLRVEAIEKGHFIPEQSTDPQWNPGYIEPVEEEADGNTI